MSTSYDIFIKTEKPVSEIKSYLQEILNCKLNQSEYADWELYYATMLGLGINLHDNADYEDDVILFSQYDYQIGIDYIRSAFIRYYSDEWRKSFSIVLADMLAKKSYNECIVVEDLAILLDRFIPYKEIGKT